MWSNTPVFLRNLQVFKKKRCHNFSSKKFCRVTQTLVQFLVILLVLTGPLGQRRGVYLELFIQELAHVRQQPVDQREAVVLPRIILHASQKAHVLRCWVTPQQSRRNTGTRRYACCRLPGLSWWAGPALLWGQSPRIWTLDPPPNAAPCPVALPAPRLKTNTLKRQRWADRWRPGEWHGDAARLRGETAGLEKGMSTQKSAVKCRVTVNSS